MYVAKRTDLGSARAAQWIMAAMALLLLSCANGAQDQPVSITLTNDGSEALQCRLMFGHWVERDLGALAPGEATQIDTTQAASDRALYILRADGARKMMIETLACGRTGDWVATRGQVDLAPIRAVRAKSATARCGLQSGARQAICRVERIES
jgi:hypothetical protein